MTVRMYNKLARVFSEHDQWVLFLYSIHKSGYMDMDMDYIEFSIKNFSNGGRREP